MKLTTLNNAEIVIQANVNWLSDYENALKVAQKMVANNPGYIDIASVDNTEQWIHLCAVWDNRQAEELKEEYLIAKKSIEPVIRKPSAKTILSVLEKEADLFSEIAQIDRIGLHAFKKGTRTRYENMKKQHEKINLRIEKYRRLFNDEQWDDLIGEWGISWGSHEYKLD